MIRLIATDLDGTLLGQGGQVTERTLSAIAAFARRGGVFVPVTGRAGCHVPEWIRASEDIRYYLHSNGARCVEVKTGREVFVSATPAALCRRAFEIVSPYPARWNVFCGGEVHSETHAPGEKSRLTALLDEPGIRVEKLDVTPENKADRARAWEELKQVEGLEVTSAYDTNIELNGPEGAKGSGVGKLADMLGIQKNEIMAFGDGLNDVSLLSAAGFPVAMENAMQGLKAVCRLVAPSNLEDGEAAVIEKMVLGEMG